MLDEDYEHGHEDHQKAVDALQKSVLRDVKDYFEAEKAEKQAKKKRKQDSPKTLPGSPPSPPPPPSGASGASGSTGASDSDQEPPPLPPPSSSHQGDQSTSTAAPSSSKTAATTQFAAWTTTDVRSKPVVAPIPEDLQIDEDMTADDQACSSSDEDVGADHIPTVNLNQSWWKPITEERPPTPEPEWTIPPSHQEAPKNNWAAALKSTYVPPPANSLLALQYGRKLGIPRPALSILKMKAARYPDAGLEQLVPDQFWIDDECKYDVSAIQKDSEYSCQPVDQKL
nr:hypothetical protein [Tanacetum cinerariifolium]